MLAKIIWWDRDSGLGTAMTEEGEEFSVSADMIEAVEDDQLLASLDTGSVVRLDPGGTARGGNMMLRMTFASPDDAQAFEQAMETRKRTRNIPEAREIAESQGFGDEAEVVDDLVQAFIKELGIKLGDTEKLEELRTEIRDSLSLDDGPFSSWGNCGKFEADGTEYTLIASEDEARDIAIQVVKQDLEEEPGMFNQSFISSHVMITDIDRRIIAGEEADSYVGDMLDREAVEKAGMEDEFEEAEARVERHEEIVTEIDEEEAKDEPDEEILKALRDEQAELQGTESPEEIVEKAKEKVHDDYYEDVKERLKDPIGYFVDDLGAYSVEDLLKASFISIDVDAAAEEAVDTDGWAHFLSRYDGNYETTPGGLVYFRET